MRSLRTAVGIFLATTGLALGQVSTNSFFNWETAPVHPIALSPDGARLAICNLPDNRLEVFGLTNGVPVSLGSVWVGLDPCSVRFRTADEVWVANFISDSISIVSLSGMRVLATLGTSNEPSDIVFAGTPTRAFVSCAQPGLVQVFNPTNRTVITNLLIAGNRPKAMAVSPDGSKVYTAIFESGNRTTLIGSGVSLGFPIPTPVDFPDGPYEGQNPPPNSETSHSATRAASSGVQTARADMSRAWVRTIWPSSIPRASASARTPRSRWAKGRPAWRSTNRASAFTS